jgi:hypothetical protein
MSQARRLDQVVDGNDLDVDIPLVRRTQYAAPDSPEPIDCNTW